jgi:hypothetical protein
MGQYYRPILTNAKGYEIVYNRHVDGEYTMAKLMEHSWWLNPFVSTICSKLYRNPMQVVWVGDYAYDANTTNGIGKEELYRLCKKAWSGKGVGVKEKLLYLSHMYLVNHTKKVYIDCTEYEKECDDNGWCIHPLPLLTAIGNGLGGGDYRGENGCDVGCWANDLISVEASVPNGYTKENYSFVEKW